VNLKLTSWATGMAIKYRHSQLVAVFLSYLNAILGKADNIVQSNKKGMERNSHVGKSGREGSKRIRIDVCVGEFDQHDKGL
jgi:hypothetical protein